MDLLSNLAAEKGLDLCYAMADHMPEWLIGDQNRLRQVLVNLVGNGAKFTEDGGVFIQVSQVVGPDGLQIVFRVEDTGIGIAPDRMDRLFQSFSQVDPSTTRKYGGTGLGLTISKRLVELMGGQIQVESTPQKGSVFTFSIRAHAGPVQLPPFLSSEQPTLEGRKVVLAGFHPMVFKCLSGYAIHWGLQVFSAPGLAEARAMLERHKIDIVLGDVMRLEPVAESWPQNGPCIVSVAFPGQIPKSGFPVRSELVLQKPVKPDAFFQLLGNIFNPAESGVPAQLPNRQAPVEMSDMRILLAEDNPINCKVATRFLAKLGYSADLAANGNEVLKILEEKSYDLILMDIQMPELDGLETTRRICARYTESNRPIIIDMTAGALHGDKEKCLEAGMDDYLTKPIDIKALGAALARHERI